MVAVSNSNAGSTTSLLSRPSHHSTQRDDGPTIADRLEPLLAEIFPKDLPVRFVFWDSSAIGPEGSGSIVFLSADGLRRLMWSPNDLGFARGFVSGEVELNGDIYELMRALRDGLTNKRHLGMRSMITAFRSALALDLLGRPPARPQEEAHFFGRRHSQNRDAKAIRHHYDVSNDFYRMLLGPTLTYSCARFENDAMSLEEAQASKHELICRKLGLTNLPGARLLDVGCGWGSMAIHAAHNHGAHVVGITLSEAQAKLARQRICDAGLDSLIEIHVVDYRELRGETFDAISSIGMFEHVGRKRALKYFAALFGLLRPKGRLLNHAISTPGGARLHGSTFMNRYVFPDGELIDVAEVVRFMQEAGFEVRDVESLREHYSRTLQSWGQNLESNWKVAERGGTFTNEDLEALYGGLSEWI